MQKILMNWDFWLALAGVMLALIGFGLYLPGIFRKRTKPHLFSWLIWVVTMSITFTAQLKNGGGNGAWVTGCGCLICLTVTLLSLRYGDREFTRGDWIFLGSALAAIPLWLVTHNALYSVLLVTFIDVIGFLPSYRKVYQKPFDDDYSIFLLATLEYLLSFLSLAEYNWITAIFPILMIIFNGGFVVIAIWRRRVLTKMQ